MYIRINSKWGGTWKTHIIRILNKQIDIFERKVTKVMNIFMPSKNQKVRTITKKKSAIWNFFLRQNLITFWDKKLKKLFLEKKYCFPILFFTEELSHFLGTKSWKKYFFPILIFTAELSHFLGTKSWKTYFVQNYFWKKIFFSNFVFYCRT